MDKRPKTLQVRRVLRWRLTLLVIVLNRVDANGCNPTALSHCECDDRQGIIRLQIQLIIATHSPNCSAGV